MLGIGNESWDCGGNTTPEYYPVNDLPNCPFGGEKNSGLGHYNGQWSIKEFTSVHWISVQHEPVQYPF